MNLKPYFFIIILFCIACSNKKEPGKYSSGTIEYKITYISTGTNQISPSLLPKKLILEFNEEICVNKIQGFMGIFQLSTYTNFASRTSDTHMKVFSENYIFKGGRNELMCCFNAMPGLKLGQKQDTLTNIAGLNSVRVPAFVQNTEEVFDVYYTYDININKPNLNNPYKRLDGVLTKFRLKAGEFNMEFEAVKFTPDKQAGFTFSYPENTKEINRNEMTYVFNRLMADK